MTIFNRLTVLKNILFLVLLGLLQIIPGTAYSSNHAYVPEPLEPWKNWVLEGKPDSDCPFLAGETRASTSSKKNLSPWRICAWSSPLELDVRTRGGKFEQNWTLYDDGFVPLPGDSQYWPLGVTVNNRLNPILSQGGLPALFLKKGKYLVKGKFKWNALPKWLTTPSGTGLVRLSLNGNSILFPRFNKNKIGLGLKQVEGDQPVKESLQIKVYRKIRDEIPATIETRILLDISGPGRETLLGRALLRDTIPMNFSSPIPGRLEADGRLRLQVKPGHWEINLLSRHAGPLSEIKWNPGGGPWAAEEVWSFQANTNLKLTELSGVPAVDPTQSNVPEEWRTLPAYRIQPGDTLTLSEIRRGNSEPAPDVLNIQREMWLDFDGKGYTVKDHISGTMNEGWRLDADPDTLLGRVTINNKDQLITYDRDGKTPGVEIRQGTINITAVSRIERQDHKFNSVGWKHGFHSLNTTVHLPPGYDLFAGTGMDRAHSSWISKWSLFDLFILLMITAAISNLMGRVWGLLAFFTIGIIYHEINAPVYIWLNILASLALLKVLPEGKFRTVISWYRNFSIAALLIISIPFLIDQARQSVHPQLEHEHRQTFSFPMSQEESFAPPAKAKKEMKGAFDLESPAVERGLGSMSESYFDQYSSGKGREFRRFDPDAKIQTGPGLPVWRWNRVNLTWGGPVSQDETVNLILIPPTLNSFLGFLRIALLLFLTLGILNFSFRPGKGFSLSALTRASSVIFWFLLVSGMAPTQDALADFPSPEMLKQLEQRLLAPPECGSDCFDVQRAAVSIQNSVLTLRLEIHSEENLAVPLPGTREQWLPTHILVDGKPAKELLRKTEKSGVWVHLRSGIHQIILSGPLPERDQVQIFFPGKPRHVTTRLQGWEAGGLREKRLLSDSLQLTRVRSKTQEKEDLRSDAPPAFILVERTLALGLDWRVHTRVIRIAPYSGPINLEIPLIPGESVLSERVKLNGSNVILSLGSGENQIRWVSSLDPTDLLTLKAPKNNHWVERWIVDASPIFHVDFAGLPSIIQQNQDRLKPQFRPWPGETLTLTFTRPEAVPGNTLAFDGVELIQTPGARVTQSQLRMKLRSSQGGQHRLVLPNDTKLEAVLLDGKTQPIRMEGNQVSLPIHPGSQEYQLKFKTPVGMAFRFQTPDLDLGHEASNIDLKIKVPRDRWIWFVHGPNLGPGVLFWGELIVVLLLAVALGRTSLTPLKTSHWVLLGLAMSTITVVGFLIVVLWLLALNNREKLDTKSYGRWQFNLIQTVLAVLTLAAVISLFAIIPAGLLGSPDMHIVGNGSTANLLNWNQDRIAGALPTAGFISVSLVFYRVAILLWALWMAFALLKWLRWGWTCFSKGEMWRIKTKIVAPKASEV